MGACHLLEINRTVIHMLWEVNRGCCNYWDEERGRMIICMVYILEIDYVV